MLNTHFISDLQFAFENIDRIPHEELAKFILPHVDEIIELVEEQDIIEECLADMS